ncbi:MAG: peroxiredoxin [Planctomycetota bacterium]|nr:peroxiredoxin [Planctomycetota bacterium]
MHQNEDDPRSIRLGDIAPDFDAVTTHGPIRFSDWHDGRWTILFAHPADFTPVCTSEFIEFAKIEKELEDRGVALLGSSIDSIYSHIAWLRDIEDKMGVPINFPLIADLSQEVSRLYGMVHPSTSPTAPARSLFFIDRERKVRAMITYPPEVGRSFIEILRVVDALQAADKFQVACPANWSPGDDVMVPPPATSSEARSRLEDPDLDSQSWYLSKKKI